MTNTDPVTFEVIGTPHPQGSKSAVGGGSGGGRARVIEGSSANARAAHKNWRTAVADTAKGIADTHGQFPDGPLTVTIAFRFPMPASRSKKIRVRGWAWKTSAPDIDKIARATHDSLKDGGLITDDSRITESHTTKIETTGWTGATITIQTTPDDPT